jgi:hypothetical protein
MLANPKYGTSMCEFLWPPSFALRLDSSDIGTQINLEIDDVSHGRADLLIQTEKQMLLVEIKTDVYCGLTENQQFGRDEFGQPHLKGYQKYLSLWKERGKQVGLCLLIPETWKNRTKIQGDLKEFDIPAHVRTWQELGSRTRRLNFGEIENQFGKFLESEFMHIEFDQKESMFLENKEQFAPFITSSLKLHELIKQAYKELKVVLADRKDLKAQDLWHDSNEHGAMLYKDGKKVLWFGIWAECGWPLVVGYKRDWTDGELLDMHGLERLSDAPANWITFKLPSRCFTGNEPIQALVSELRQIVRA